MKKSDFLVIGFVFWAIFNLFLPDRAQAVDIVSVDKSDNINRLNISNFNQNPGNIAGNLSQNQQINLKDISNLNNRENLTTAEEINIDDSMDQVTSVSQLSDVKPTDWAYQALQSLIKRHGIMIPGYPDGTFHGNRSLTRYEFASVLKIVLEKFSKPRYSVLREDLNTLIRLQREYATALAELGTRLDKIDPRIAKLEINQFSPTTKLQGQVIAAFTGGSNSASTIVSRTRLNLVTIFKQNHVLLTQLEMGNNGGDALSLRHRKGGVNLLGTTGLIANGGGLAYGEVDQNIKLSRLYYTFQPISNLGVTVGARMTPKDFIDRNRYANNEAIDFNSSFFINNPLIVQNQIDLAKGAGAAVNWDINKQLRLNGVYIAADADRPNSGKGLFNDRYQGSVELQYTPNAQFAMRLQYTNAQINNTDINAYGLNVEYDLNNQYGLFGRFGFGHYQGFNTAIGRDLNLHPWSWAVGITARNFIIPGTLAGVAIGQPFVSSGLGNATQTNFEGFGNFKISDNISITPSLMIVTNANNDSANGFTFEGTFKTVFSF